MLSIEATNDKEFTDALSQRIFKQAFDSGVGFVLITKNTPIGMAKVLVNEVATISGIGIVPEEEQRQTFSAVATMNSADSPQEDCGPDSYYGSTL